MSKFELPTNEKRPQQDNGNYTEDKHVKIADTIGTGEHAKNGLVYIAIQWCFISAVILSIFSILNCMLFRVNEKVPNLPEDLKLIWTIFTPIITLALGYAFGKSQK